MSATHIPQEDRKSFPIWASFVAGFLGTCLANFLYHWLVY